MFNTRNGIKINNINQLKFKAMNTQKKYIISKSMTFKKTEEELREWAEEIRQNEGLQDVTPDYTEKEWTQDHDLYDEYVKDIEECIEFLEGYDWEIIEQNK